MRPSNNIIFYLSSHFYTEYPPTHYPELMHKTNRPYLCLLIPTNNGYYICVPFRSNIHHRNAYFFKHSKRSREMCSGLDYSKIVIIQDIKYLDLEQSAIVDRDEYKECYAQLPKITQAVKRYVSRYADHITGRKPLHPQQFARLYQFSTLPYFHQILLSDQ